MYIGKKSLLIAGFASLAFIIHNAAAEGVKKEISVFANINDSIFVSKPNGSSWYVSEELYALDYKQASFSSKNLPVRIYTTGDEVNVSLVNPLVISRDDGVQLSNVKVSLGDGILTAGKALNIKQINAAEGGYESIYNLKITADAPQNSGSKGANGSYQGDLVMLFEPKV